MIKMSDIIPNLDSTLAEHSLPYADAAVYILDIIIFTTYAF